ncbi:transglutaminaseTgpA domain-containing protein [Frankia sp. AgW1.1]|uniref:DUF4129 domain-containing transglutaminase family protein n=1 Tax=Frankia sp. AgW1.1 TaxID=1836971 RepID=UPI0019333FEC|nr:transglutaminaseTgpA domain-containing protein [Frankia sp. AgW1.1]MBL7491366.1 DUF4129 domain-containing protein [Frankia sp. AgW1.1]
MTSPSARAAPASWALAAQAALVSLAGLPSLFVVKPLFDGSGYLGPLAGTLVVAAVAGWLIARRVASGSLVCVVGVVAGLAFGTVGALVAGDSPWLATRALREGWPRLLSVALPARPSTLLLVPLAAIIWVTTYAAVALAVRTEQPLAPGLAPLLGLAGLIVLVGQTGGGARGPRVLLTGAAALLVLAAAALRAARPVLPDATGAAPPPAGSDGAPSTGARRLTGGTAFGLLAVLVVAAVAPAAGALVPSGGGRFDPRDHYHPPVQDVALLNPLGRVRNQLEANPARTVFTVRLVTASGKPPTDRLRVAELGDFDGATWGDDGRFVLVDRTLPTPTAGNAVVSTVGQVDVRADVTVGSLDGDLLPTLGAPGSVTGAGWAGTAYDPVAGTLVALATPRAGDHYALTAQVPAPTHDQLEKALPATGPLAARYVTLPAGLPSGLSDTAARSTAAAARPYDKLVALQAFLRDGASFPYDLSASPGHSYGVLDRLLAGTDPGDNRGYSEQHAAAFAVLARSLGFPTRVAVGYLLDSKRMTKDGAYEVTTGQAHAWPEVLLDGIGWVPFEPTDTTQLSRVLPPPPANPSGGTQNAPAAGSSLTPPLVAPAIDDGADQGGSGGHGGLGLAWPILAAVLALVVILGVPLLIIGEKARRRWRRRSGGDAGERVEGAWREVRDRLSERGVPRARAWTRREVVWAVAERPVLAAAVRPLERFVVLADLALYSPAGAAEDDAVAAWLCVDELRAALRDGVLPRGRLGALLDPRPLFPVGRGPGGPVPAVPLAARGMRGPMSFAAPRPRSELPTRTEPDAAEQPVPVGVSGGLRRPAAVAGQPGPTLGSAGSEEGASADRTDEQTVVRRQPGPDATGWRPPPDQRAPGSPTR